MLTTSMTCIFCPKYKICTKSVQIVNVLVLREFWLHFTGRGYTESGPTVQHMWKITHDWPKVRYCLGS